MCWCVSVRPSFPLCTGKHYALCPLLPSDFTFLFLDTVSFLDPGLNVRSSTDSILRLFNELIYKTTILQVTRFNLSLVSYYRKCNKPLSENIYPVLCKIKYEKRGLYFIVLYINDKPKFETNLCQQRILTSSLLPTIFY